MSGSEASQEMCRPESPVLTSSWPPKPVPSLL
ncbi:unnamed protein product [Oppiella nova]|uniref:Uncharacterized protein n=1 Tax=Oppiella nova TaxID=334625 RepID=A0A7R9MRI5_9ACAR|nr:unnamed protein product [Oppiella nova]CAG2181847.1 unnamed protein product [Oppiella nova]